MNLETLKDWATQIKEMKPIGRTLNINGVVCHMVGIVHLTDGTPQLWILEYDEVYCEKRRQAKLEAVDGAYDRPATNRFEQHRVWDAMSPKQLFVSVEKVHIGSLTFTVTQSGSTLCSSQSWESVALFTHCLLCGWEPSGISTQDVDYLYLTRLTLDRTYGSIPDIEVSGDIRFSMRPIHKQYIVEQPVTLTMGHDYDEKTYFTDNKTGKRYWIQINRVFMYDIWAETAKTYDDPRISELLSSEELARRKAQLEAMLADDCPKGMCYPAIEYECEKDISVQFYSKQWLASEPAYKNHAMGFIMSSERSVEKLGLALKAALIQEPLPGDTQAVDAELFSYSASTVMDDIVFKAPREDMYG